MKKNNILNLEFNHKLLSNRKTYLITLKNGNKELEIKNFTFGLSKPNIEDVLCFIGLEYRLFKNSPTLEDYIDNRGFINNIEEDYTQLKEYIKEYKNFFGEEVLEQLMYWNDNIDEILVTNEICNLIRDFLNKTSLSTEECFEYRDSNCSIWNNIEELLEYLNQNNDSSITIKELQTLDNVKELSNGFIFYIV
ncbi:hypothetical protein ACSW8S_16125 (plasmid) [Clostridium perfringens]